MTVQKNPKQKREIGKAAALAAAQVNQRANKAVECRDGRYCEEEGTPVDEKPCCPLCEAGQEQEAK